MKVYDIVKDEENEIGMSEKDFDKKLYPVINWSDDGGNGCLDNGLLN